MVIRRFALGVTLALVLVAIIIGVSNNARAATVCTPTSTVSGAYARDGAGDVCFQTATLCSYINSWNMNALEVNGTDYTNRWVSSNTIAPLNGGYIIHYVGSYPWSHFEIGGSCSNVPTAVPPTGVPPTSIPPTGVPPTGVPPTGVPPTGVPPSSVSINAGGSATGSFTADQYFSGGSTYTNTATIDMSQITTNPPPAAIFNTERYGAMTYTIPNRSGAQTVTLYFAETYLTAAGQRLFNVSINGTSILSNFDIYASAGGANRAIARTFNTTANSSGQVVIQFTAVTENPKINGITVAGGNVNTFTLTVTKAGSGSGTVSSSPAGINSCSSTCTASFPSNTSVTLTQSTASGSTFGGWSGACSGTGSCVVTMNTNQSVTAAFNGNGTTRPSAGCGKTRTLQNGTITINNRTYILRGPDNYSNTRPYRLIVGYHWLGGTSQNVASGGYYGLLNLANNSTIFIAPMGTGSGSGTGWPNTNGQDLTFTDAILNQVQNDLCVDLNRIYATGFSYGAGMSYAIACDRANVFRGVALYAGGLLSGCSNGSQPIAYFHAHGVSDTVLSISGGRSMRDRFVRNNGCTAQSPQEPAAGSGRHICTSYQNCSAGHPVRWCAFDGGHQFDPRDAGQSSSWVPQEVWNFIAALDGGQ